MRQYIIAALTAALALAACTDEIEQTFTPGDAPGEACTISITAQVMDETPALETPSTKAVSEAVEEEEITDLIVIQYAADGNLLTPPQYVEYNMNGMSASLVLPKEGEPDTYVVAIANTHDSSMEIALASCATLDQLRAYAKRKQIRGDDDMFEPLADESGNIVSRHLLMSAEEKLGNSDNISSTINFRFYRNVAKLTLNINNEAGSGVTVNSIQLRNVPDHIFLAECLRGTDTQYPKNGEVKYIDFPKEDIDITAGGTTAAGPHTSTYYLPRNCRGNSQSPDYYTKSDTKYAPGNATYVEIWATKTTENTPIRYRFYLGGNMKDNYDVVHNHHYTLTVNISDAGSNLDGRVTDYGVVTLGESNSYIINPIDYDMQSTYKIPAVLRCNRFWELPQPAGDPNYALVPGEAWVAEVIWQDKDNRLINFCNPDGSYVDSDDPGDNTEIRDEAAGTKVTNAIFTNTKDGYIYFKPVRGAEGNVVIGLKRSPEDASYMWSWHLWITGYKPDDSKSFDHTPGRYIYSVEGGEVHHYEDLAGFSNPVWAEGRRQHGSFIMDRNLGATSASLTDDISRTGGLCYQYGRKDPFPRGDINSVTTYDIFGRQQSGVFQTSAAGNNCDFKRAVQYPTTFFTTPGGEDWYKENDYSTNFGNDPETIGVMTTYGKSIFDPSPEGWHLPQSRIWNVFSNSHAYGGYSNGWLYYISNQAGDSAPAAWYPMTGYFENTGRFDPGYCCFWNAEPAVYMYFNGNKMSKDATGYRTYGCSIRVVQYEE